MRSLIISDLHLRIDWVRECLETEKWDEVIFLGDYFDNFNDTVGLTIRTANWLKALLELKAKGELQNFHFLIGNHDQYYCFPFNWDNISAGFSHEKNRAIRGILKPEHWAQLELYYIAQDNFLLSHAGFNRSFYDHAIPPKIKDLKKILDKGREQLNKGLISPILSMGKDKCGQKAPQDVGGITWQHWSSFTPLPGINQIVGHSSGRAVRRLITNNSRNYCLDTSNRTFAILDNGFLIVKENKYL